MFCKYHICLKVIGQNVEGLYKEGSKLKESGLHNFDSCNDCINNIMENWDCLNRLYNLRDELLITSVQFHDASEEVFATTFHHFLVISYGRHYSESLFYLANPVCSS